MKSYVLDASALLAFLGGSPGAAKVANLLDAGRLEEASLSMSVINWGEVYYLYFRTQMPQTMERLKSTVARLPIEMISVDMGQAQRAGEIKAQYKMAYADSFAAALAIKRNATLVTSDRDFKRMQSKIKVMWLLSH